MSLMESRVWIAGTLKSIAISVFVRSDYGIAAAVATIPDQYVYWGLKKPGFLRQLQVISFHAD